MQRSSTWIQDKYIHGYTVLAMIFYLLISFVISGQAMTWQGCYDAILQGLQQGVTAKTKPLVGLLQKGGKIGSGRLSIASCEGARAHMKDKRTLANDRRIIARYVRPLLGEIRLADLRRQHVEDARDQGVRRLSAKQVHVSGFDFVELRRERRRAAASRGNGPDAFAALFSKVLHEKGIADSLGLSTEQADNLVQQVSDALSGVVAPGTEFGLGYNPDTPSYGRYEFKVYEVRRTKLGFESKPGFNPLDSFIVDLGLEPK
jgi:hypothetical protein